MGSQGLRNSHTGPIMSSTITRRILFCGTLAAIVLFLVTAFHYTALGSPETSEKIGKFASTVKTQVQEILSPASSATTEEHPGDEVSSDIYGTDSEKGTDEVGKHFHVDLSTEVTRFGGIEGCEYPVVIHITPDVHCTGALALYGSIVRNVLLQPALQEKTCVHFTYVDPELKTIHAMYRWPARDNPFTEVADCAALDNTPALNDIVPVRFQALVQIEKPAIMEAAMDTWLTALNKVHSWGFDVYPRILLLDADSMILTDLDLIFDETSPEYTIAGAADQWHNCRDRGRINGGMILLRPSRYFHITALERLYDPSASCKSGKWDQSEQELLNCICGTVGEDRGAPNEFACLVMPLYNSIWPRNYGCSAANVIPMRSIHFAAVPKPWKIDEEERLGERFDYGFWKCVRDGARAQDLDDLVACEIPASNVTRLVPESLEGL
ncbi:hypothetical protein N0V93_002172 [Gnomoniopsis smithogilvyi]|uniref:Glycosyltransferase family 8 protein n=1 Tax=Gnomoniopsis smithogilvyi TaxID=1191159 RepID=A0A9W9CYT8_9PEZI|nr:hypothetical protein N0V93_002172 [Gnomoniopsis smithogilvyi]